MKPKPLGRSAAAAAALLATAFAVQPLLAESGYRQNNLVSDVPGLAAHTDPNLINGWGISSSATSPFWVSSAGGGVSTLYNTNGVPLPLVVSIPLPGGAPSEPTGQVFNGSASFNGDRFIFATAQGTFAGWRGALGTVAETLHDQTGTGAAYTGLAIGTVGTDTFLYAADFGRNQVEVVGSGGTTTLAGSFTDPNLPSDFSVFNVQNIANSLYVTYAKLGDDGEEETGPGLGFVDRYDLTGNLMMRVATEGVLNAPWAVTMAPDSFGQYGGSLLVGNFGDGMIHAFDPTTGDLLGSLKDDQGNPIVIEGLWGLQFGNGGNGGKLGTLYFAAGPEDETHGLFGSLTPVPEPSTVGLAAAAGLLVLCAGVQVRRRRAASQAATVPPCV